MAMDDLVFNGTTPNNNATIIVQNGNKKVVNQACLPCDEGQTCTIGESNGSRLDLSKMKTSSNKIRFNIDTTQSQRAEDPNNIPFFTPLYSGTWCTDFPKLCDYFGDTVLGLTADGEVVAGENANGDPAGAVFAQFNVSGLNGGATIGILTFQYDCATYPHLDGMTISLFTIPTDPNKALEVEAVYSPLCDSCTSSNNGNFCTHRYAANMPVSGGQGVVVYIPGAPGGAKFTMDLCLSTIGFKNNEQKQYDGQ